MMKSADIALSGISSNIGKMDAASNNITNVNTPDYKAVRVPTVENAAGGARGTPVSDKRPGNMMIYSDTGEIIESSNSNLAMEFTNLMMAQRGVNANGNVIRTSDEIIGTIFDIVA